MHQLTEDERTAFERAASYYEAAAVAISHVRRRYSPERPLLQVCGPISTGGLGSREQNLKRLRDTIDFLVDREYPVFDQSQFEGMVPRFSPNHGQDAYDHRILDEFYVPLFETKCIQTFVFLSGWTSSVGTCRERAFALAAGFRVLDAEALLSH